MRQDLVFLLVDTADAASASTEIVAKALLFIFEHNRQSMRLMKAVISRDIQHAIFHDDLFTPLVCACAVLCGCCREWYVSMHWCRSRRSSRPTVR